MMSEWKTTSLGEICTDISYGYTESASAEIVGPKFLRITDIQHDFITWANVPYCRISPDNHRKYKLENGDIVIARTGASTGATAIFKDENIDAVFASYLIRYKVDKSIADPFYIGHILRSSYWKSYVASIIGGSAQPGANAKQFAAFEFHLPDLPTQRQIAQILSSLDDKIELNLQMNQTLEAMAQAIFKEWFVHFNYPKLSEHDLQDYGKDRMKNEKVKNPTNQINPDNPVQDKLVDGLPKGWRMGRVDELFVLQRGFDLPAITRNEGIFPVVAASGISTYHNDFKVTGPGVTTGRSGVLGNVFYISEDFWPLNTSLFIKEFKNSTPLFAYHFLQTLNLIQFNGGSAVPTLNRNDVHGIECIIPELEVIRRFEEFALSIFTKIDFNKSQIQSLTQTRDTLLPKLMSGQLEVAI